jgi:hypothetical protein
MKRISVQLAAISVLLLVALPLLLHGQVQTGKFHRVGSPIPNQYIVVFNDDIPAVQVDSLAGDVAGLQHGSPHAIYKHALKGFSIHDISEPQAIALSNDPRVEFVEENCKGSTGSVQNIDYSQPHAAWQLDRVNRRDAVTRQGIATYTYNQTGTGVHAYVLDTGILLAHTEFGGRAVFDANFVNDGYPNNDDCLIPAPGEINRGHGTEVAGELGAATFGVAKNVTIHSVRVCDCSGGCNADIVTQGIDWVTGQHISPAVANMSLQLASTSNAVEKAIRKSMAAGTIYVVIAGNGADLPGADANAGDFTPSRIQELLTVASTDITDARESGSKTGSVVDLFSPGHNTPAPIRTGTSDIDDFFLGTSSAAPKVAGAAAMYLETNPTACPCTVGKVLTDNTIATLNKISDYDPKNFGTPNKLLYVPSSWPTPTFYSLSLDGASGYVQVPTASSPGGVQLNITGLITVEAWIKLNSTGSAQGIIERFSASDGGYALRVKGNGKLVFINLVNGSSYDSVTGSTALAPGLWYHVAGVWGGLTMNVYVNGVLDGTKSSTFAPGTGSSPLYIGRIADVGGYFNGMIDEARVTADALYTSNFTPQHRLTGAIQTKGLWRFDDQTANDCAGFNNGTLNGGATFSTDVP